jgi:NAD(P)-dependent dehydrogenase (short-subunit alcohol dehydrogenase family)
MDFSGRVVVVTGAGSGIGRASALRFAAEGADVLVADVREAKAQQTVEEITAAGGRAAARGVDVSDGDAVRAMVESAVDTFGRLDVLFNNAATTRAGTAVELSAEDWTMIWNTNVSSVFHGAKHAIPLMTPGGVVLSTASVSGLFGDAGQVAYATTKAAVINLTRALAVDHAAQGIRVNCICPGMTATPSLLRGFRDNPDLQAVAEGAQPLGRFARPEEIAAAALWLASDESSFVTGQALVVDGGLTAQNVFGYAMGKWDSAL